MGPVGIHLARLEVRDEDMPVVIGAVPVRIERDDPRWLRGILVVEQQQLDQRGVLREHAEVDAVATAPWRREERSHLFSQHWRSSVSSLAYTRRASAARTVRPERSAHCSPMIPVSDGIRWMYSRVWESRSRANHRKLEHTGRSAVSSASRGPTPLSVWAGYGRLAIRDTAARVRYPVGAGAGRRSPRHCGRRRPRAQDD